MDIPHQIIVPFNISSSNHFVIEGKINNSFARYILDSGAGRCCMGIHKAKEIGLEIAESNITASGVGDGYLNRFDVSIPKMTIGNFTMTSLKVAALDLRAVNQALEGIGESSVFGIIGTDILLGHQAILDYQQWNILFEGVIASPFKRMISNHLVVETSLEKTEEYVRFIIDTGASQTCIDTQKAKTLGYSLEETEEKATGTGSTKMPLSTAIVPKMSFGDFELFEYQMTLIDLEHVNEVLYEMGVKAVDGIIGADVLWRYQCMIDCGDKQLILNK